MKLQDIELTNQFRTLLESNLINISPMFDEHQFQDPLDDLPYLEIENQIE